MRAEPEDVLRRMSAGDEQLLQAVVTPVPEYGYSELTGGQALDRRLRGLVRIAALLAVDAPTTTLRWAVEQALSTGTTADAVVGVLIATADQAGTAQVVSSAPRLALALGFDLELEGWDGT
jgi:4-carboxymuconolactone decarboxylase